MDNYIDFYYDENDNFIADIFSNGRLKRVRNPKNIDKLISIAEKYNYIIEHEGRITKRVAPIINEFGKYMLDKKRKRERKIKIYNSITNAMKLTRKDPTIGKRIGTGLLALTMATTGIWLYKSHAEKDHSEPIAYSDKAPENHPSYDENFGITTDTREIDSILQDNSFHYLYEDRSNNPNMEHAKEYRDLFEKYGKMYGIDPNILMAIAAQESGGDHNNNLKENAPACGIMQIEKSVHLGENIAAYNFETGDIDQILITEENLQNIETNIQIATIIFKDCLKQNNYNIPLAIQAYNYGYGNMYQVLRLCASLENTTIEDIKNNPTNNCWLKYRNVVNVGDEQYLEHVLSYLDTDELTVTTKDGNEVSITIKNNNQKSIQYN